MKDIQKQRNKEFILQS